MKDDRIYLNHILRCIARIEEYTAGGRESFFASHLIQDGVIRNLQTLAESSHQLSESVRASQPSVDGKGLAGFRNVLVHDYLGVDLGLLYRAVEQERSPVETCLRGCSSGAGTTGVEARGRITPRWRRRGWRCTHARRPPRLSANVMPTRRRPIQTG